MATKAQTFTDLVVDAQKQALSNVKQTQDLFIRATELAVGSAPANFSGLSQLPSPKVAVEAGFDFAGQLLKLQRDFAVQLVDAIAEQPTKAAKS